MKFQSFKLCLVISAAASFVACSGQIQTRHASASEKGIPVKAVAQAQLLDISGTLDDLLNSELKIEDIKAAIEKLTAELSKESDVNLDEVLDVEELANSDIKVDEIKAQIDSFDLDKDGTISSEELALVMVKWEEKIKLAKEKHDEKFKEKREEFCAMLQDRILKAKDDKFLEAILLKNGLAKCAGIIAAEDSDDVVIVTDPAPTETPEPTDEVVDVEIVDAESTVLPVAPVAPVDAVCKNVSNVSINVTQDSKKLVEILIKICQD